MVFVYALQDLSHFLVFLGNKLDENMPDATALTLVGQPQFRHFP